MLRGKRDLNWSLESRRRRLASIHVTVNMWLHPGPLPPFFRESLSSSHRKATQRVLKHLAAINRARPSNAWIRIQLSLHIMPACPTHSFFNRLMRASRLRNCTGPNVSQTVIMFELARITGSQTRLEPIGPCLLILEGEGEDANETD